MEDAGKRLHYALVALNEKLKEAGAMPIELEVVGDFALLRHHIRKDPNAVTSIEYFGEDLSDYIEDAARKIGFKYNLGAHWLNNDIPYALGSKDEVEDMLGKLRFLPSINMSHINISILDKKDLLRLKTIIVDQEFIFCTDFNTPFDRKTDLKDIVTIAEDLRIDLSEYLKGLEENGFIGDGATIPFIEEYVRTGNMDVDKFYQSYNAQGLSYDEPFPPKNALEIMLNDLEQHTDEIY